MTETPSEPDDHASAQDAVANAVGMMAPGQHATHQDPATGDAPVALVAGGSRGLGLLVAAELGRRGYQLAIGAREEPELEQAEAFLARHGVAARHYVLDVSDHIALEQMVAAVERDQGPIEVAVHVAGVIQVGPLSSVSRQQFEQSIAVMLWGPINLALAVLPGMRGRGHGRVGIVSSIGGMVAVPHLLPYSVAKFGAVGLAQGVRAELAGTGVTVTTVAPGLMRTGSHLRAEFTGHAAAEYAWFASAASAPLISMSAERAAAKIVKAVVAGKGVILLTPLAKIAARFSGLAPGLTGHLMGVVARLLPRADHSAPGVSVTGAEARVRLSSRIVESLTILGSRAARRLNEVPAGPVTHLQPKNQAGRPR